MRRKVLILCLVACCCLCGRSQRVSGVSGMKERVGMSARMGWQEYAVDSAATGTLGVELDALAFFKDNEFDGSVQRGYSLPGFRVQPRLAYCPLDEVKLEIGFHATVYDGANKYPCYAFHDIATWKGDQYQAGAHVLPFLRATGRFRHVTVAVGNIYGGATHALAEPLYNPELILSDDPEMGCQVLVDTKRWHSDLWLNWQSYIFEESTHQEAFTVGWTQEIELWSGRAKGRVAHNLSLPIQLMAQHRGGEQDKTSLGVQTLVNAALGLRYSYAGASSRGLTGASVELLGLGCYQQSGRLWPFNSGWGMWLGGSVDFFRDLRLQAALFTSRDFCTLYGSPYFGTVSTKFEGGHFSSMTTALLGVEYSRTFAGVYTIGAHIKCYLNRTGSLTRPADENHSEPYTVGGEFRTPFSFGVYFRLSPSFLLMKRVKRIE